MVGRETPRPLDRGWLIVTMGFVAASLADPAGAQRLQGHGLAKALGATMFSALSWLFLLRPVSIP